MMLPSRWCGARDAPATTSRASNYVGSFSRVLDEEYKKPGATEWMKIGPHVGCGAFDCKQLPSDVVRTIDGRRLVIFDQVPPRFAGKLIDIEAGRFLLKDR